MRVLVVTNMYPPHHFGGYELWCADVVHRWRANGHAVQVLSSDLRLPSVTASDEDEVRRDLRWYWEDHRFVSPSFLGRLAIERHNQRVLKDALDRFEPDVVSLWHMGGMSLGMITTVTRRGMPAVFVVHDDWLSYALRVDAWMRAFERRPFIRGPARLTRVPTEVRVDPRIAAFCFVSEFIRRKVPERWPTERSAIVPSGIDLAEFPQRTPSPGFEWRLLCVGRVESRKGAHVAVDAVASLPVETTLELVGMTDPAYEAQLEAQIAKHGLAGRVRFSSVARAELHRIYAAADVLLFPVVWEEPWGLVPIEAMATGTPVVATGTGGSAEYLVDGSNCLIVPPDDAPALAAAVRRLAGDPTLRMRLVRGGYQTAERFDADKLAAELEAWHAAARDRFMLDRT